MAGAKIVANSCFVIGPIGRPGTDERKLADFMLKMIVKPALEPLDFKVKRADDETLPGAITDHIINDIQRAELIVADLTRLNPNAMYELGIAHMALRPTIPIAQTGTVLPFDNLSQRTIFIDTTDYDSVSGAIETIHSAAVAIRAPEYKIANPVTQANGAYRMQNSSDPNERAIANLQLQMSELRTTMDELVSTLDFAQGNYAAATRRSPGIRSAQESPQTTGISGVGVSAARAMLREPSQLAVGLGVLINTPPENRGLKKDPK